MGLHSSRMLCFEREQFPLDRMQALYECTRLTDLDQEDQLQSRS